MLLAFALLWLSGVAGCSTFRVQTDYDPQFDFSALRSWSWAEVPQKKTGDPLVDADSLLSKRVRRAVEEQLVARGYPRVEAEASDFRVAFFIVVEDKLSVTTINDYYGYGPGWRDRYPYGPGGGYGPGGASSQTVVDQYREGSLILDVARSDGNALVWRGSATTRLSEETSPEKAEKKINEAVSKLLAAFPPKGSGG